MSGAVLHDYWRSSASYRVRIGLALKGISWHSAPVDLAAGAQREAAHRALNPQGLVPVLQIDGLVLTQSLAILEYLDETRPTPPLLPASPAARAQVRALSLAIACEVHPLSNLSTLNWIETLAGSGARVRWNADTIATGLTAVETMLAAMPGPFCAGDRPGLADCLLVPQLYNADRWGIAYAHLPRIAGVAAACAAEPAFAAAHPDRVRPVG